MRLAGRFGCITGDGLRPPHLVGTRHRPHTPRARDSDAVRYRAARSPLCLWLFTASRRQGEPLLRGGTSTNFPHCCANSTAARSSSAGLLLNLSVVQVFSARQSVAGRRNATEFRLIRPSRWYLGDIRGHLPMASDSRRQSWSGSPAIILGKLLQARVRKWHVEAPS